MSVLLDPQLLPMLQTKRISYAMPAFSNAIQISLVIVR